MKPEDYIGREIIAFRFDDTHEIGFAPAMEEYIGKKGKIIGIYSPKRLTYTVEFRKCDTWNYPISECLKNLVEEIDIKKLFDEIKKL